MKSLDIEWRRNETIFLNNFTLKACKCTPFKNIFIIKIVFWFFCREREKLHLFEHIGKIYPAPSEVPDNSSLTLSDSIVWWQVFVYRHNFCGPCPLPLVLPVVITQKSLSLSSYLFPPVRYLWKLISFPLSLLFSGIESSLSFSSSYKKYFKRSVVCVVLW